MLLSNGWWNVNFFIFYDWSNLRASISVSISHLKVWVLKKAISFFQRTLQVQLSIKGWYKSILHEESVFWSLSTFQSIPTLFVSVFQGSIMLMQM